MTPDPAISILLATSNYGLLESLSSLFSDDSRVRFIESRPTASAVLEGLQAMQPMLCLIDWKLSETNGPELTRRIKSLPNPPRVVLMTFDDNDEYRSQSNSAGADALIRTIDLADRLREYIDKWF